MRMFGVGDAFKEAVGSAQEWNGDFRAIEIRSEAWVMAFAGFAEEHGADGAGGAEGFFDEPRTFDTNGARFGRKAAAKSYAKFLEPFVFAGGDDRGMRRGLARRTGRVGSGGHGGQFTVFSLPLTVREEEKLAGSVDGENRARKNAEFHAPAKVGPRAPRHTHFSSGLMNTWMVGQEGSLLLSSLAARIAAMSKKRHG